MRRINFVLFFMGIVCLMFSLSFAALAVADNENYFTNGSFEDADNIEMVGVYGSPVFTLNTDSTEGDYSLHVSSNSDYAHIGFPLSLEEGRTYSYSFDIKLLSNKSDEKIENSVKIYSNFRFADENSTNLKLNHVYEVATGNTDSGWMHVTGSYTPSYDKIAADADLENAYFCVYVNPIAGGGSKWLIDNVVLVREGDGLDNVNYFTNGSFEDENNIETKAVTGNISFSRDLEASDGVYSLKVTTPSNYAHIGIPLTLHEGRKYKYSFDIKLLSNYSGDKVTTPTKVYVNFVFADENSSNAKKNHLKLVTTATTDDGWMHVTGFYIPSYDTIAADSDLENAQFCIYVDPIEGGGAVWLIDNVVLKRAPLAVGENAVETPDIISDNMLIQKGEPTPIWGKTGSSEDFDIVLYNGNAVVCRTTATASNGEFEAVLPAVDGYYKHLTLAFERSGNVLYTVDNVAVGELWHFSGQSNMSYNINENLPDISTQTNSPDIHYFKAGSNGEGQWVTATATNIRSVAAIPYKTLETIYNGFEGNVPVGGVNTAVGGMPISTYMKNGEKYLSHIVPISRIPVKGHIWYQGESNTGTTNYVSLQESMISQWRELWGNESQPFIFVQLPRSAATLPDWYGFLDENGNPTRNQCYNYTKVHMQQYESYNSLKDDNVHMIVTVDVTTNIENQKSVENKNGEDPLHPWNKAPVGVRLGNMALGEVYGKTNVVHEYPMPGDVTVDGKYITIVFDGVYEGLETTGTALEQFEIIDENGQYHTPSNARITSENTVVLYSNDVPAPSGVCYFHEEHLVDMTQAFAKLVPSLVNSEGLPASPFTYTIKDEDRVSHNTVSVPANSTVCFADGSTAFYREATDITAPETEGYIYVNTGFDTHAIYAVNASGNAKRLSELDNAIVGIDGASMRTQAPQGLRYYSYASKIAKNLDAASDGCEITEYGFIVTAETSRTGLVSGKYTLDMNLVSQNKALTGVAYKKGEKDTIFAIDDDYDRIIFTAVLLNIPETKEGYTTTIAYRPYYILSDGENQTVVYGTITTRSVFSVATLIKSENGDDYINNKEYIDSVIETVGISYELENESTIDASGLFRSEYLN